VAARAAADDGRALTLRRACAYAFTTALRGPPARACVHHGNAPLP